MGAGNTTRNHQLLIYAHTGEREVHTLVIAPAQS